MERKSHRVPAVATGDGLAQQLDIVVAAGEHALVERLLQRPDRPGHCAADGSSQGCGCGRCRDSRHATVTGGGVAGTPMCDGSRAAAQAGQRARGQPARLTGSFRAVFQPFFHLYFRMSRTGREHIPAHGPVIIASNHRSFLDPFVIGTMARRPDVLRRQARDVHRTLAVVGAQRARGVSGGAGQGRCGDDRDRQGDSRAGRHPADVPGGDAYAPLARSESPGVAQLGSRWRPALRWCRWP